LQPLPCGLDAALMSSIRWRTAHSWEKSYASQFSHVKWCWKTRTGKYWEIQALSIVRRP
jgi:hypothetical protein